MNYTNDTIAAIASPQGLGGVGVIRVSGPASLKALQTVFLSGRDYSHELLQQTPFRVLQAFNSHKLTHGYIVDWSRPIILDEVMAVYMRAPATYTGEDTVEIYTHGGRAIMNSVLDLLLHTDIRLAEPGEYTKRAFFNGKLDLTEAEAVADVINAETEKAMLSAGRNLRGGLSQKLHISRETLLHAIMLLEASIDFPEDVEDSADYTLIKERLQNEVINALQDIHKNYIYGCYLKHGLKLAVVGRPNVGKSSLMNTLLRQERVLVSEEAGTTRDVVTEHWNIGGFPVELADTAGIHETSHNLEQLGIQKSYEIIDNCDYILFIFEAQKGLTKEDNDILNHIHSKKIIGVANKTDLGINYDPQELRTFFRQFVPISIKKHTGLAELEKALLEAVTLTSENIEDMLIPNLRQSQLLEQILACLTKFNEDLMQDLPAEYLCVHLEEALKLLNTILGLEVNSDILDAIFSNFCIGK